MDLESAYCTAKALADRSRLRTLHALRSGPLCVEELARALDIAPSTVSFHLKKLAGAGLVTARRDQYYAVYSLRPEALDMTLGRFTDLDDAGQAERTARLEKERREVIDTFLSGDRLTRMPAQKRKRSVVLEYFACLFEPGRTYEEPEVNDLITPLFPDYCLVRRLLIDEGYLVRADQVYRRTDRACSRPAGARRYTITERRDMDDTKKALKRRYKLEGRPAGIFRVRNDVTGKVFVGSSLDLNSPLNRIEFELQHGISRNRELQEDYGRYGRKKFTFEIVEVLDPAGDPAFTVERRLEELEQAYAANLDRTNSYNTKERLRFP